MLKNKAHLRKTIGILWLAAVLGALFLWWQTGVSVQQIPQQLRDTLMQVGFVQAAIIYIVLYTVRPLLFFPGSVLSASAGVVFGSWFGLLFTYIGGTSSAVFAFLIARFFGRDAVAGKQNRFAQKWDKKLQDNGLETVLLMRLLFFPFDAVNFGCGLTSMKLRDFTIGTIIGILPGSATFVLLGGAASEQEVFGRVFTLGLSFVFFVLGIVIARLLKRYSKDAQEIANQKDS